MLEKLHLWPQIRVRILSGPFGTYVASYLSALRLDGYSKTGIRRQLRCIDAFGSWLSRQHIKVEDVDEPTVERFVGEWHVLGW